MALDNWMSFMQSTRLRELAQDGPSASASPEARILAAFRSSKLLPIDDVPKLTGLKPDEADSAIENLRNENLVELIERGDTGLRYLHLTSYGQTAVVPT